MLTVFAGVYLLPNCFSSSTNGACLIQDTRVQRRTAADAIPSFLMQSLAKSTIRVYGQGLRSWRNWCREHPEVHVLPVEEMHLATFIVSVIQSNGRFDRVEGVFYALNWLHNVLDIPNPCESSIVQGVKGAAKRVLSRPVRKKEPLSSVHVR